MKRAYLKLYFLLILPILIMTFLPQNPLNMLATWWGEEHANNQYGAIYPLIMEELKPQAEQNWPQVVDDIGKHFAYPLKLLNIKQSHLKRKTLSRLKDKGYALTRYEGNQSLAYFIKGNIKNYVLIFSLESHVSNNDAFEKESRGFRYFLNKKVKESGDIVKEFKRIKKLFKQELTLNSFKDFVASTEIKNALKKHHVYTEDKGNFFNSYVLSDNQDYVITIKTENSRRKFWQFYRYLSSLMPAILLAIGAFIWLFLFRKELQKVKQAAKKLGKGDFNTRVDLPASSTLHPIADSFNDMATRIQTLIRGHQDLTNAVSHELKTPLSRLHFSLEMLKESKTESDRDIYTKKIENNISTLETLVDELLGYSRMQHSQTINIQSHSIKTWLENEISNFTEYHPDIDLNLDIETQQTASFDVHLMSRALSNLLSNAANHADPQKPQLRIKLDSAANKLSLSVEDNGAGIKKEDYKKIFEPFTRLDKSRQRKNSNKPDGYGMGLAIVKSIILQHRGDVTCEQSDMGGVKITLHWPIKPV